MHRADADTAIWLARSQSPRNTSTHGTQMSSESLRSRADVGDRRAASGWARTGNLVESKFLGEYVAALASRRWGARRHRWATLEIGADFRFRRCQREQSPDHGFRGRGPSRSRVARRLQTHPGRRHADRRGMPCAGADATTWQGRSQSPREATHHSIRNFANTYAPAPPPEIDAKLQHGLGRQPSGTHIPRGI